jgi:isoleucyl-tRNA synthetase
MIPLVDQRIKDEITHVKDLILAEVNVKELEFMEAIDKSIKPNFKTLGKKAGAKMKLVAEKITLMTQEQIAELEVNGHYNLALDDQNLEILREDVEILSREITGFKVANEGALTVALDIHIDEELRNEGIARELVSKLQGLRKELDFEVTDKISVKIVDNLYLKDAINQFKTYICSEILATEINLFVELANANAVMVDETEIKVLIEKA